MAKWYRYYQNNSFGVTDEDPAVGLGHVVYIEATSPGHADHRAQEVGIYFDENYSIDCRCCGTRWDPQDCYWSGDEGVKNPPEFVSEFYARAFAHPIEGPFYEIPIDDDRADD
jgi:hypothetical protein